MKKSENSQKNEPGKSYKLNCSLHNFDNTNLLKMIYLSCAKKMSTKERNSFKPLYST